MGKLRDWFMTFVGPIAARWLDDHREDVRDDVFSALSNTLKDEEAAEALWSGWDALKKYLEEQMPDEADVIEATFNLFEQKVAVALPKEWKYIGGGLGVVVDEVIDKAIEKLS